jgi:hypothetical protein
MTDIPMKITVDCSTGESTTVPLTPEELSQREIDLLTYKAQEAERLETEKALSALKASAKAKLVAGQPLTEEEASVLIF